MDIKKYLGKIIKAVKPKKNDIISVFDQKDSSKIVEILVWADESSNYAALNLVVKDWIIKEIYRERFCWMCPEGKCAEKRISKFPAAEAEETAEKELRKLLAK